jgi:hypothetical protein
MKALRSSDVVGSTYPMTQHHIPEDLNLTLIAICIVIVMQQEHSFGIKLSCLVLLHKAFPQAYSIPAGFMQI